MNNDTFCVHKVPISIHHQTARCIRPFILHTVSIALETF